MNINKGNIDEHLFEYFEDQMSPAQADVLMDFIHQNPEFEKDFVQWKKAYHHKDHVKEDYGIAAKIKASIQVHKGFKPYFFGGILVLGLALGWLINSVSGLKGNDVNIARAQAIQQNGIEEKSIANRTAVKEEAGVLPNPKRKMPVQEMEDAVENVKEESNTTSESNPIIATEQPRVVEEKDIEKELSLSPENNKLTVAEVDSNSGPSEIQTPKKEKSAPQKQKKKGKRKGIFSTSEKILPVNTNF